MRILIFGSSGFVGRSVVKQAIHEGHEVVTSASDTYRIDLSDQASVRDCIINNKPDVVINCAGILSNDEQSSSNKSLSLNLLNACSDTTVKKVVSMGSAAEYGVVMSNPVNEDQALLATSFYGKSKVNETNGLIDLSRQLNIEICIARLFNPIGVGMKPKFLIPNILKQIQDIKAGKEHAISVNRLDSTRDYLDVRDAASAIVLLATKSGTYDIYNVGSGVSTSNLRLIEMLLNASNLEKYPELIELSGQKEPNYASAADITRITNDYGWLPQYTLIDSIEEILKHA